MIHFKSWKQVARDFLPLTSEELDAYEKDSPEAPACTADQFRLCFERPWKTCSFNKQARFVFITAFLASIRDGCYKDQRLPRELLTHAAIGSVLDAHMVHAREMWRLYQKDSWESIRKRDLNRNSINSRKKTVRHQYRYHSAATDSHPTSSSVLASLLSTCVPSCIIC